MRAPVDPAAPRRSTSRRVPVAEWPVPVVVGLSVVGRGPSAVAARPTTSVPGASTAVIEPAHDAAEPRSVLPDSYGFPEFRALGLLI